MPRPTFEKEGSYIEDSIYLYYSTQRPVDIGTTPRPPDAFINFDERQDVQSGAFRAWGIVFYKEPLTEKEMTDYELRPSRDNPDIWPTMQRQAELVGAWEERNHIPKSKRLTCWEECIRCYLPKEAVTPEMLEKQYRLALEFPNGPLRYRNKSAPRHRER